MYGMAAYAPDAQQARVEGEAAGGKEDYVRDADNIFIEAKQRMRVAYGFAGLRYSAQ